MRAYKRRDFLRQTVGAFTAAACLPAAGYAATGAVSATTRRKLGQTGLTCSLLGIGTGTKGRSDRTTEQTRMPKQNLIRLLNHAYERGITYFDLADRYGSHPHMKEALKNIPREKVMLLTKAWDREPEKIKADIERFRKELDTDYLDVVLMHCLRRGEEDWPNSLRASMDVLSEAKQKGLIRAHGVSCHTLESLNAAADTEWTDVVLARINPFGVNMDGPVDQVVPALKKLHDAGKGVLAMKVLGEGKPEIVAKKAESIQFVLGLGAVDAMTIGFIDSGQLDEIIDTIQACNG